jgi:hypothetical protein
MSEVNLLGFGCAVSFIALAGAYAYIRDSWAANEQLSKPPVRSVELEDVA